MNFYAVRSGFLRGAQRIFTLRARLMRWTNWFALRNAAKYPAGRIWTRREKERRLTRTDDHTRH